jgi:flagellar basal body P-ring formation protein FlgA
MIRTLFSLAVGAALLLSSVSAHAVSLRGQVLVDGDVVRLGDIFEGAGPRADAGVVQAPAPGRRISYDANWLGEVARIFQLQWRPQSRFDRVTIERAGRTISAAELITALKPQLIAEGMNPDAHVELMDRGTEIAVSLETPAQIDLRTLSYDKTSGRFSSSLIVGGEHPSAIRVAAVGRIFPTVAVPVLRRAINPGEVIREGDIEWTNKREDQVRRDVVTDQRRLVGTTPRARLSAGQPVRDNETKPPVLVARNATVTILLQSANMTLTAQGRANEDGARGDTIRITNLQSNKVIEATVSGPDVVVLQLGARATTAAN